MEISLKHSTSPPTQCRLTSSLSALMFADDKSLCLCIFQHQAAGATSAVLSASLSADLTAISSPRVVERTTKTQEVE